MTLLARGACAFVALFALTVARGSEPEHEPLLVFAAASLADSLQRVSDAYTRTTRVPVRLSFAASAILARQIESGARADVFLSADPQWMDYLQRRQLIEPASRVDLLGNRLALIAPSDSRVAITLRSSASWLSALGPDGRLALGDPAFVPAGTYAKAALSTLGLWDALQARVAPAENVRVALAYVARGEAPLGIVYATDARIERRVRIVALFTVSSHPPIIYPVAITRGAAPGAVAFTEFLRGPAAQALFAAEGFEPLAARNGR